MHKWIIIYLSILSMLFLIKCECSSNDEISESDSGGIKDVDISMDTEYVEDVDGQKCSEGSVEICYTGPSGTLNVGICISGKRYCTNGKWGDCLGEVLPRENEICGNGLDDNCNGSIDEGCGCIINAERECYNGPASTKNIGVCKAGKQKCEDDGNGNGKWGACVGEVEPSSDEICGDGLDNNCNGKVDEGCTCKQGETQECFNGPEDAVFNNNSICKKGLQSCVNNEVWGDCEGSVLPQMEICGNAKDDDCDGVIDNGCICKPEEEVDCYDGPIGTKDKGICHSGKAVCKDGREIGECKDEKLPEVEVCDGIDNDCNGLTDDGIKCLPEDSECKDGDVCLDGTECVYYTNGKSYCTQPCTPDGNECKPDEKCTQLTNGKWYCIDKPDTPTSGCGWVWGYAIDKGPPQGECNGPYGTHVDMGGGRPNNKCFEPDIDCQKIVNKYDCGGYSWWVAQIKDSSNNIIDEVYFNTLSFGIHNAKVLDYCVLGWGFHKADPTSNTNDPLIFESGTNTSYSYKAISINSDLFNNFAKIDPVDFNNIPSVQIVWDVSAESLKDTKIPYDYYGIGSSGTCEYGGKPSLEAGTVTYKEMVEYVQTKELKIGVENDEYNISLAFYLPHYFSLGYKDIALTSGLYCHSIDGDVYSFRNVVGIAYEYICNACK